MEPIDFLMHQKMTDRTVNSQQQPQQAHMPVNLDSTASQPSPDNKPSRVDQAAAVNSSSHYDQLPMFNFYPVADQSSVVLTRAEYEAMKQEIAGLKRTLADFRVTVDAEIDALKRENKLLKRAVNVFTVSSCQVHCTGTCVYV